MSATYAFNFTGNQRTLIDQMKAHPNGDRVLDCFLAELKRRESRPISLADLESCEAFGADHHARKAFADERHYYVHVFKTLFPGALQEAA